MLCQALKKTNGEICNNDALYITSEDICVCQLHIKYSKKDRSVSS
jgi:hypothetical protein